MWFWKKSAPILSIAASSFLAGRGFLEKFSAGRPKLRIAWSNLWCAVSLNPSLGYARWKFQEMPWSSSARFSPRFHVNSVVDKMVPLESAQNFASLSPTSARFYRMSVILSSFRDRAIQIPNQYDSFTWMSADSGIYQFPGRPRPVDLCHWQ